MPFGVVVRRPAPLYLPDRDGLAVAAVAHGSPARVFGKPSERSGEFPKLLDQRAGFVDRTPRLIDRALGNTGRPSTELGQPRRPFGRRRKSLPT